MHGDILAQTQVRDPEVRRHTLQSAVRHYSRCFLLPIISACFVNAAFVQICLCAHLPLWNSNMIQIYSFMLDCTAQVSGTL